MCKTAPALLTARNELNALFPNRGKGSDGSCPSAAHTAKNPKSDHEPNAQGYSRAYDFDEAIGLPGPSPLMPLIKVLLADPRCKYVIYEEWLYYPDGTVRKNKGHTKHLHLSIKNEAVLDTSPWNIKRAFENNDELSDMEATEIIRQVNEHTDARVNAAAEATVTTIVKWIKAIPAGADVDEAKVAAEVVSEITRKLAG